VRYGHITISREKDVAAMPTPDQRHNAVLAACLVEAGWSPRQMAREINAVFGTGTVSESAPYYWRDAGGVPHPPLPALAAYVLSRHLGRSITVAELWQDRATDSPHILPATAGLDQPWTPDGTQRIAEDLLLSGLIDRRVFLTVSGAGLARAVWAYLSRDLPRDATIPVTDDSDPLVAQIEHSIPYLQRLDDARGGAANLAYVGAQVRAAALILHDGGRTPQATRRLLIALADLSQLAGWMAFDAGQHGLAQRYLFTGLRAAHTAGYNSMAGHILADLAFQAATLGHHNDGIVLGEAAVRAADRSAASVRASITSRLAYAYAGAGRHAEFDRYRRQAVDLLAGPSRSTDPAWMYYLTPNHLDCQAGYSLILMGRHQLAAGDRSSGRRMVRQGKALLATGAHDLPVGDPSDRRALFEGAWLALGFSAEGRIDDACGTARAAMARLTQVRSPRSTELLHQLARDLTRRQRSPAARELLPDLRAALHHAT
jgi:hypothetical protein